MLEPHHTIDNERSPRQKCPKNDKLADAKNDDEPTGRTSQPTIVQFLHRAKKRKLTNTVIITTPTEPNLVDNNQTTPIA